MRMPSTRTAAVLAVVALAVALAPAARAAPLRAFALPMPGVQAVTYGAGSLWVASAMDPANSMVFELDPATGTVRSSLWLPLGISALAHDGT